MLERARQLPNKMKQQRRERKSTVPEVSFDNLCAYISLVVVLESTCVQSMLCLTHALNMGNAGRKSSSSKALCVGWVRGNGCVCKQRMRETKH